MTLAHRSAAKEKVLTAILQKILEISTELTAAEKGSLFLLNSAGVVTDSILTRKTPLRNKAPESSGQYSTKGLPVGYDNSEKWD